MATTTTPATPVAAPEAAPSRRRLNGWYGTLFMSDMFERFGFYGMLAIFALFAAAPVAEGGLGLPRAEAAALVGSWLGVTFILSLPGGWLGDRVFSPRRAVVIGGIVLAAGYLALALPRQFVPVGLAMISIGFATFKPNLTTILNLHYGHDSSRREAGISIIYVGIQVSALIAPLITGFLGERVNWRLGFAAAGIGASLSVLIYLAGRRNFTPGLGSSVLRPVTRREWRKVAIPTVLAVLAIAAVVTGAITTGNVMMVVIFFGLLVILTPPVAYVFVRRSAGLSQTDRKRFKVFTWLLLGSTFFWLIAGQDSMLLNLFARDSTERDLFGFAMPASWLQAATPLFILVLAPLFAIYWLRVGRRISVSAKFATGLLVVGLSFVVMAWAALLAADGTRVSPVWLLAVYLMHACGELIIAAVGLSAAAEVAPPAYQAQIIGLWWLFSALGAGVASQLVQLVQVVPDHVYYLAIGLVVTAFGLIVAARRKAIAAGIARPAEEPAPTAA